MKRSLILILCMMLFMTPSSSANPFTTPAKPAEEFSLSDAMDLVGEEVFADMLTEVKQNIICNLGGETGVGIDYSPYLYAVIDSLTAEGLDPYEAVYSIGDTDPAMNTYFTVLKDKGYLAEIPSSYTEEVANEVRKIQYAAGLPATGEITAALADSLLIDSAIPSNKETLRYLTALSEMIIDQCIREMDTAAGNNRIILALSHEKTASRTEAMSAVVSNYIQAREYLPSFTAEYQFHDPVIGSLVSVKDTEIPGDAVNIASNSSALLYVLFYYARYDLKHDFTGYAVEYAELNQSETNSGT